MHYILALVTLTLAGCSFAPPAEEVFSPPAVYREWFAATEACSGHRGDFDRVVWMKADLTPQYAGFWRDRSIWIDREYLQNQRVVAHEALHFLLQGDPNHTDPAWIACRLWGPTYLDYGAAPH